MRHFLSYDATGLITGQHTYKDVGSQLGGWPEEFDLDNPDSTNQAVIDWKAGLGTLPHGFVLFDCNCPCTNGVCPCCNAHRVNYRVDLTTKQAVEKPASGLLIDGAPVAVGAKLDRAPGTPLELKITAIGAPDGALVTVAQGPVEVMQTSPVEVAFTSDISAPLTLVAPAQGSCGKIRAYGLYTKPVDLEIRGWA
jgi:hypothetical protein